MSGTVSPTSNRLRRLIAKKVRRQRNELGLTLQTASELSGIHWRHWQKIEAGEVNVTLETLARLAKALAIEVYVLLQPESSPRDATFRSTTPPSRKDTGR